MSSESESSELSGQRAGADDVAVPGPSQLWASNDVAAWAAVLQRYDDALQVAASGGKSKAALPELDRWYRTDLPAALEASAAAPPPAGDAGAASSGTRITRAQLEKLVEWKLARGQWRPRLLQFAREQPEGAVEAASAKALSELFKAYPVKASTLASAEGGSRGGDGASGGNAGAAAAGDRSGGAALRSAVEAMTSLKGVGPATASALLAAACPDVPYMGDEALAACLPAGRQSDYSLKAYLELACRLQHKARQLSEQHQQQQRAQGEGMPQREAGPAPPEGDAGRARGWRGREAEGGGGGGKEASASAAKDDVGIETRWTAVNVERCLWAAALLSKRSGKQPGKQWAAAGTTSAGARKPGGSGGAAKRARR